MITLESPRIFVHSDSPSGYAFEPLLLHPTEKKIWSFESLEPGWHFGEGKAFNRHHLQAAVNLHQAFLNTGFDESDAFPGTNGEVRLTFYLGDDYLEFTLEPNGRWTALHEKAGEELLYRTDLTLSEVMDTLPDFRQLVWTTSDSFRSSAIGTSDLTDSKAWLLSPLLTAESR